MTTWRLDDATLVDRRWRDEWLKEIEWRVYRSLTSLCLVVRLNGSNNVEDNHPEQMRDLLRDQTLDLADWNTFQGYALPVACLVSITNMDDLQIWQKFAGDQEWLRGQFSLQITTPDEEEQKLSTLLGEYFPDIPEVRPLSDKSLSKRIRKVIDERKFMSPEQRQILVQVAGALTKENTLSLLGEWDAELREKYQSILNEGGESHE